MAVVLDMTMPRMNGAEALRAIREIDPTIPIVLSSGYDERDSAATMANDPYLAFMQKPYRLGTLISTIRELVASRGQSNT